MITLAGKKRALAVAGLALGALLSPAVSPAAADTTDFTGLTCGSRTVSVRLTEGGPSDQTIRGTMCWRGTASPVVHLLLPGASYSRHYWMGDMGGRSYVRAATNAGYTTFAIDRIGTGTSSKPPSADVTVTTGALAIKDVITKLRAGTIAPRAFTKVILVAHSLGATHSWMIGNYADGLVLSAELHRINHPSWQNLAIYPATSDPKFASSGLDTGYQTTWPQARASFYYVTTPTTIIQDDENTKDLTTNPELAQAYALVDAPPASTAPSRALTKPVLVIIGAQDPFFCNGDSIVCTQTSVTTQEAPYYAGSSSFTAKVLPGIGHSLALHESFYAQQFFNAVLNWTTTRFPPSG